jgi:hypothetical protein
MERRPTKVKILLHEYTITYCDKPSEVDLFKRDSLWGQIDYWTRTIRVYDKRAQPSDILQILLHEILHGIAADLHLGLLAYKPGPDGKEAHDTLDLLSLGIADVLIDNGWITFEEEITDVGQD